MFQLEKQTLLFQKREQDLLQQLMLPLPQRTLNLISQLKADHEALLHSQLALLQQHVVLEASAQTVPATQAALAQIKGEKLEFVSGSMPPTTHPLFVIENTATSLQAGVSEVMTVSQDSVVISQASEHIDDSAKMQRGSESQDDGEEEEEEEEGDTVNCSVDIQDVRTKAGEELGSSKGHHVEMSMAHGEPTITIRVTSQPGDNDNMNGLGGDSEDEHSVNIKRKSEEEDGEDVAKRRREET